MEENNTQYSDSTEFEITEKSSLKLIPTLVILGVAILIGFVVVLLSRGAGNTSIIESASGLQISLEQVEVVDLPIEDDKIVKTPKERSDQTIEMLARTDGADIVAVNDSDMEVIGAFLVSADSGMSLYLQRDNVECEAACFTGMMPYLVEEMYSSEVLGDRLSTKPVDGGQFQVVWDDKPLYFYGADEKSGDLLGDGYQNAWSLARP